MTVIVLLQFTHTIHTFCDLNEVNKPALTGLSAGFYNNPFKTIIL